MYKSKLFFFILLHVFSLYNATTTQHKKDDYVTLKELIQNPQEERQGKLFPVFQIVRFPNDPCIGDTRNGTCYTADECNARSGTGSGTCAQGFGICCIISKTCGQMTNENCTYFTNAATIDTTTDCALTVCPCNDNICQIRLDFNSFVLTGPTTVSTSVGRTIGGRPFKSLGGDGKMVSEAGQCQTDCFTAISPGNSNPPVLCGTLTNEHIYMDLNGDCCDELRFSFGAMGMGSTIPAQRSFDIKITQYSCSFNNLAPPGCTQYFFGSNEGQVMSFNFGANQQHLADQNQNICIRRERANCRICWAPTNDVTDFALSGPKRATVGIGVATNPAFCCGYGASLMNVNGFDCLEIPGAKTVIKTVGAVAPKGPVASRFCFRSQGLNKATICSTHCPFSVRFRSDRYEFAEKQKLTDLMPESQLMDAGFRLAYKMDGNCP